ncbi:MAG TPA: hypothetical protein VFQ77_17160 [Pseudonocardiaceae bacterium]|jgi:ABC-type taurine transport system ATPase subunit|nr:hypothetical protein [Pseudonocardiaceae bacterium]
MVGLVLERVPVPGVPASVQLAVGERRALVVADREHARTLADLLTGLAEPPHGTVITRGGAVRLVPAEGGLLPHLTVLGNLVHASYATGDLPRHTAAEACRETAIRCGLHDVLDRYPYQITPGTRRLAGVARALCARASVIVLEDAAGLPTWGALLDLGRNLELGSAALLLITSDRDRVAGFTGAGSA